MDLPKALKNTLSRFPILRKRVRLNIVSGSTSVNSGGIVRVKLPSQSLIDLNTFSITGTGAITGTNASVARFPNTQYLLRRVGMNCGVNIGYDNNNYNQVAHALNLAGVSIEQDKGNCNASYEYDKLANGDYLVINHFPASPLTMGVIDSSVTGDCEVDIQLAGDEALIFEETGVVGSWSISNLKAFVDVLEVQNEAYRMTIMEDLQNGGEYKKVMTLATCQIQTDQGSNSFAISTQCLDKLLVGVKPSTYLTKIVQASGDVWDRYFNFTANANASIYFQVNSETLPVYGHSDNFSALAELTRNNWAGSVYNYNKLFLIDSSGAPSYTQDAYASKNAVVLMQVGGDAPAVENMGKMTGIDLSGNNSIIRCETQNMNAGDVLLMAGIHSSLLVAKAGQQVAFQK